MRSREKELTAASGSSSSKGAAKDARPRPVEQDHLEQLLDEALEETFPASDPIAVTPRRD